MRCPTLVDMLELSDSQHTQELKHGAHILDPVTGSLIPSVGAMSVDDSDLYCWVESM